ncbi:flagellar motor switch protein FliG [Salmonella enterica subsp. enterica]|uniref:Flagellar motor switch protein FliG n=2 Tax=Salmonella enterica I TaxID=59201 RepID=A0A379W7L6_SALET|nr:flagellar motor switch protein FliG [Salmonella enterica subsp. enterica]
MSNLSGTDKSVILLMTIGEDRAAEVFKHLSTHEVQALSTAMANVRQISNKQLTDVLSEFEQEAEQFAALNINANEYLRSVLVKALGEERASSLLEDILETRDTTSGIETLNFMEPQSAADLIRDEHPQIIATILVHLKRSQAADILALFDERLRHDVMLRIATFGGVQPAALAELTEVLNGLLDGQNLKRSKMGGVRTAAEIINLMKTQQEEAVITAVREFDGELAQKIIDEMFLFENLVDCGRSQYPASVAGSGFRIAADRSERRRTAITREVPAQYVPARRRYPARRPCQPWPGSSVSGGKRAESDSAYCASSGGNRRNGDWQRRGYLCLMNCRGKSGPPTISPRRRRRLCRLRLIT